MKILKMTIHWTTEEADCIYQLLNELQSALWQSYGEDIQHMHDMIRDEQLEGERAFILRQLTAGILWRYQQVLYLEFAGRSRTNVH